MTFLLLDESLLETLEVNQTPEKTAVLAENFSWLLKNLKNFDPGHVSDHHPVAGRGERRIFRGQQSKSIGYDYKSYAKTARITNKGTEVDNTFGYPVHLEKWEVRAPWPIKDPTPGSREVFKGPAGGDHYTCYITSRADLKNQHKTRCYVSCNCSDFRYTFMEDLIKKGYTREPSGGFTKRDPNSPNAKPHDAKHPAICKHLFAILDGFYMEYINKEKGPNESAELFKKPQTYNHATPPTAPPPPAPTKTKTTGPATPNAVSAPKQAQPKQAAPPPKKTQLKAAAKQAIKDALIAADNSVSSSFLDSYIDSRKFSKSAHAAAHIHKYKFWVNVENDGLPVICYVNAKAGGSSSGIKRVTIPKFTKATSYALLSPKELKDLITMHTTELSPELSAEVERMKDEKPVMFYESVVIDLDDSLKLLNETSDIKRSLMELKFKG